LAKQGSLETLMRNISVTLSAVRTQVIRSLLLAAFATAASVLLLGCNRDENVKKGDPAYPEINPAPVRLLTLTAKVPATLSVDFYAAYIAGGGGKQCGWIRNFEVGRQPFTIADRLSVERNSDTLRATIAVDKYLPGNCQWSLNGITWQLANGDDFMGGATFAVAYDARRDVNTLGPPPKGPVYLVCKRDPTPRNPQRPGRCTSMDVMRMPMVGNVSQNLIAQLPSAARGSSDVTWIMPDTTHIEINFYDLDAMVPTDSPLPLSQPTVTEYGSGPPPPR
jgi:hypothetical protein